MWRLWRGNDAGTGHTLPVGTGHAPRTWDREGLGQLCNRVKKSGRRGTRARELGKEAAASVNEELGRGCPKAETTGVGQRKESLEILRRNSWSWKMRMAIAIALPHFVR